MVSSPMVVLAMAALVHGEVCEMSTDEAAFIQRLDFKASKPSLAATTQPKASAGDIAKSFTTLQNAAVEMDDLLTAYWSCSPWNPCEMTEYSVSDGTQHVCHTASHIRQDVLLGGDIYDGLCHVLSIVAIPDLECQDLADVCPGSVQEASNPSPAAATTSTESPPSGEDIAEAFATLQAAAVEMDELVRLWSACSPYDECEFRHFTDHRWFSSKAEEACAISENVRYSLHDSRFGQVGHLCQDLFHSGIPVDCPVIKCT